MMENNLPNQKIPKLFVFLAAGLFFVIPPAGAEGISLSIHDLSATAGSTISVPVSVKNAEELSVATIDITYDPAVLKFKGTELGDVSKNGIIEATEIRPGVIEIDFEDSSGVSQDGELVKALFEVTSTGGSTSQMGITANALRNLDNNEVPVETIHGGNVTVNGSGKKSPVPLWCPIFAAGLIVLIAVKRRA